jgi:hypothetical protein
MGSLIGKCETGKSLFDTIKMPEDKPNHFPNLL